MIEINLLNFCKEIHSIFWNHTNKQWARYLSPLLLGWDENYFLAFSCLQELAKERNLIISEKDFHQLKHHFNGKNGRNFLNNRDLTLSLNIIKIKKRIKGASLYLYIDSNKKVHNFYFSNNEDLDTVKEFFRNSLASNGLPYRISHLVQKAQMIRNKFDIIKNNPDIDIF